MQKPQIDLDREIVKEIIKTILNYKNVDKVVLFGSRASATSRETSDIDIAIFAKPWSDKDTNMVKHLLDESVSTLLKFDVVHFGAVAKSALRRAIVTQGKVIYESRED